MKISIIGTGNVGSTLGRRWADLGHELRFGSRRPDAQDLHVLIEGTTAKLVTVEEALLWGEVILLAIPYEAALETMKSSYGCAEKVVIDATNPIAPGLSGLAVGQYSSAAEEIQKAVPHAHVVKCFNMTGFNVMADPEFNGRKATMFLCGSDAIAKTKVKLLSDVLGFDTIDCGPLKMARYLEPLAMLWISFAYPQGHGREIAMILHKR